MKKYKVSRTVKITYTHIIEAKTAKDAELIARDMGDINADDGTKETDWKATKIK